MDALQNLPDPPQFKTDAEGKPSGVEVSTQDWLLLLVRSNITNPELWPPEYHHGARLLERIREIETACAEAHGAFDWEQLSEELQDEYDSTALKLDRLLDNGERLAWTNVNRSVSSTK